MAEPPLDALDPVTLPLSGSRLVEASAGTGKTWTIAALVLRLVLGHGGAPRALAPAEILVVTFTKAATRELSGRIRGRLVEAAAVFAGTAAPQDKDGFLPRLLQDCPDGRLRRAAADRLKAAADAMDDAAVFTIDAWCQRMLREHAFDSGCLFDEELLADAGALVATAARDYWRQQVYPLAAAALQGVLGQWVDVDDLARDALSLLEAPLPPEAGCGSLADCIAGSEDGRRRAVAALQAGWVERAAAMQRWLDAQFASADCPFDRKKLQPSRVRGWLDGLQAWAAGPPAGPLDLGDTAPKRLAPAGLRACASSAPIDPPPVFTEFEALLSAMDKLPVPAAALREHAAGAIARRLRQLKAESRSWGFADMLQRLDDALDPALHGARAARLRERIVAQYPAALIDEFQDTSPVQLSIFDRIYRIAENDPARLLLLIGDPKQAIFGFRGADIHSYLRARAATQGRHHALATNHRSTAALVDALNHVWGTAEARAGAGAFLFRGDDGSPGEAGGLPYVPVTAAGRDEQLVAADGSAVPPLTLCLDAAPIGRVASRRRHAELCAEHVVELLDGSALQPLDGGPRAPLRPGDIAVLVRTGREAAAVRGALRRRGVASVYLSDQDSVFATREARDLLRLLQAVAAPRDVRLARAAFATPLVGSTLAELLALATDDALFDACCERLLQWQQAWHAHGVLAMLRRALHALGLPARWLAEPEGERALTNVLHLAELLQSASAGLEGEQALIRWLAMQIDAAAAGTLGDEARVLRLESDADLVQVITIFKSKGLEYNAVLLPFAAHQRDAALDSHHVLPGPGGTRTLVLAPDSGQRERADIERRREDVRLLYVALTRARHAVWVCAAALKADRGKGCLWHRSALGWLVSGPAPRTPEQLADDVRTLAAGPGIVLVEIDAEVPIPATPLAVRAAPAALAPALRFAGSIRRDWGIASYSALVRDVAAPLAALPPPLHRDDEPALGVDTADESAVYGFDTAGGAVAGGVETAERAATGDVYTADGTVAAAAVAGPAPWHRFPRGAHAGNFLHDALEWLAGEGWALADDASLRDQLARRCERHGWAGHAADAVQWLQRVATTPLPPIGVSLERLAARGAPSVAELEFWLPADGLATAAIDAACRRHVLPGRPRPPLPQRSLAGMLMGFADLVFEHGGRWWVLDHKSNALGTRDADYATEALDRAMLDHRYDVQAAIYLLALHRLLRQRLSSGYVPARDLGGAVYCFLRGVAGPAAGCWTLAAPQELVEELDALLGTVTPEPGG